MHCLDKTLQRPVVPCRDREEESNEVGIGNLECATSSSLLDHISIKYVDMTPY